MSTECLLVVKDPLLNIQEPALSRSLGWMMRLLPWALKLVGKPSFISLISQHESLRIVLPGDDLFPIPLKTFPFGVIGGPCTAPPDAVGIFGGLAWTHVAPKAGCTPAPWSWSPSLITSSAYASSVRSKANTKLVLAVSHTNVVLTISVPSSLFPPSP